MVTFFTIMLMMVGLALPVGSTSAQTVTTETTLIYTNTGGDGLWSDDTWLPMQPNTFGASTYTIVYSNDLSIADANNWFNVFALNQLFFLGSDQPVSLTRATTESLDFAFAFANQTNSGSTIVTNSINRLPSVLMNSTNTVDLELPITLETNTTFNGTGSGTVTLGGPITGPGQLIKGTVGGGSASPNIMILTNTGNTYAGGTIIGGGVLIFGVGAYPTTSNILVSSPGVVWFQDGTIPSQLSRSSDGGFAIAAAFANTSYDFKAAGLRNMYLNAAQNLTYGGVFTPYTNAYNFGAISGVTLTITNNLADISGTAGVTTLNVGPGSGTVALFGNNTFSGNTIIKMAGTLSITNDSALGNATNSVTLSSGGILQVTNANITTSRTINDNNTGGINVAGTQILTLSSPVGGPGVITKSGDGTLDLQAINTVGGVTINGGQVIIHSGIGLSNAVVTMNVPNTLTTGFTNTSTDTAWVLGGLGGTNQLALTSSTGSQVTSLTLGNVANVSGVYSGSLYGLTSLIKNGTNTQVLNGLDTSSEPITINGGILEFGSLASIGGSGANITLNNGATAAAGYPIDQTFIARIAPGSIGVVALAVTDSVNNLSFTSANLTNVSLGAVAGDSRTYSGTLTPNGMTYQLGGGGGTLTLSVTNALTSTNKVLIQGIGVYGGTVVLASPNNYTGGTTVTNATLQIGDTAAAGTGVVTVNNATLNLAGGSSNGGMANTLSVIGDSYLNLLTADRAYSGVFSNSGTLHINLGGRTLTSRASWLPFTGTLDFSSSSGTLRYYTATGSSNATYILGTNTFTINERDRYKTDYFGSLSGGSNTTLLGSTTDGSNTWVVGGNNADATFAGIIINGAGGWNANTIIQKVGSGVWTLSGNSLVQTQSAGTGGGFAGGMYITNNGAVVLAGPYSGSTNYGTSPAISGNIWSIFPNNGLRFSNTTSAAIGALKGPGGFSLTSIDTGAGVALTINSAPILNTTNSGNIVGTGGSIIKEGPGVLTLSGINTYTGGTTIRQGVLAFGSSNSLPSVGQLSISNGASVGLFFTGIQTAINNLSPSTAGGVAISAGSANENVNFATAGITNAWLVAASTMKYGGIYTPYSDATHRSYKLGANAAATLFFTNTLVDLGGPTSLQIGNFGGGTVALFANLGVVTNPGPVLTTNQLLIVTNSYSGGTFVNGAVAWSTLYIADDKNLGAPATLTLSNAILQVTNSFTLNNRPIVTTGSNAEFNVEGFSTLTVTNVVSGPAQVQKWGAGTLIFSNVNTFTGGTVIGSGLLAYATNVVPSDNSVSMTAPGVVEFLFIPTVNQLKNLMFGAVSNSGGYGVTADTASQNVNFGPTSANAPKLSLVAVGTNPVFYSGTFEPYGAGGYQIYNLGALAGATLNFTNNITNTTAWVFIGGQGGFPGTVVLSGTNSYATNSMGGGAVTTIMSPATLKITSSRSIGGPGDGLSRTTGGLAFSNGFATLEVTNNVDFTSHAVFMDAGNGQINVDAGSMLTIPTKITMNQNGSLTKGGAGVLWLTGVNASTDGRFLFDINFNGGVVRADPGVGVYTGQGWQPTVTNSSHTLNGGVWEFTTGGNPLSNALVGVVAFGATNSFGVRINGGVSGYSAYGNDVFLAIRNATNQPPGSLSTNAWGFGGAGPSTFVLNEATATANLTWSNAIDMAAAFSNLTRRTIAVNATNPYVTTIANQIINLASDTNLLFRATSFGGLTKTGIGKLILTTNETYSGGTRIDQGTLALTQSGALTNSAAVIVSDSTNDSYFDVSGIGGITIGAFTNQTLGGGDPTNGEAGAVVLGNVTIASGSLLAPGDTDTTTNFLWITNSFPTIVASTNAVAGYNVLSSRIGTLTLSNNLTLNSGSAMIYDLGSNSDLVVVGGNVTLGGTVNVRLAAGLGFGGTTTYRLMNYSGTIGGTLPTIGDLPTNVFNSATINTNTPGQVNLVFAPAQTLTAGLVVTTNGVPDLTIRVDDSTSLGVITNYFINFGDSYTTNLTGVSTGLRHLYASCGTYTVTVTVSGDSGSSSISTAACPASCTCVAPSDPYTQWETFYGLTPGSGNTDPFGKGMSLTNQFAAGLNPNNPASVFRVIGITRLSAINTVTWKASGGDTNAAAFNGPTTITDIVQGSVGTASGGYSNNFSDVSASMVITPAGDTTATFSDSAAGSGTNKYYRIRLVP
jgi:autotransporter-associated beta strand protein